MPIQLFGRPHPPPQHAQHAPPAPHRRPDAPGRAGGPAPPPGRRLGAAGPAARAAGRARREDARHGPARRQRAAALGAVSAGGGAPGAAGRRVPEGRRQRAARPRGREPGQSAQLSAQALQRCPAGSCAGRRREVCSWEDRADALLAERPPSTTQCQHVRSSENGAELGLVERQEAARKWISTWRVGLAGKHGLCYSVHVECACIHRGSSPYLSRMAQPGMIRTAHNVQ